MASPQDVQVGLVSEVTYNTPLTVTRFGEPLANPTLTLNKNIKQGQGLRVASRVARSGRRVIPTSDCTGDVPFELASKGMGLWWQLAMGAGTSTLVSGSTFQQVFTFADTPPSATVQVGLPEAGGTADAYTYAGAMCSAFTINCPNGDIANVTFSLDAASVATATALATASYPTTPSLFHFANGSIASGTLTAPTTTALASGTTTIADVRAFSMSVNHNLATDRFNFGASGKKAKPTVGLRDVTGTLTAEYDVSTYRDAVINETPAMLILNFTGAALSSGTEQIQIVIPEYKLDSPFAQANGTDLITTDLAMTVLDNLTAAQPLWIVCRTSDAAL